MKTALSILILFGFSCLSFAATYCVGPSASGSGNGADWSNLKAWTDTAVRGDTWLLVDGSYAAKTFNVALSGSSYITIKKATVASHGGISTGWSDALGDGQADFGCGIQFWSGYMIFDGMVGSGFTPSAYGFKINQPANCAADQNFISVGSGPGVIANIIVAHVYAKACDNDVEKTFFYCQTQITGQNFTVTNIFTDGFQGAIVVFGVDTFWMENLCVTNSFSSASHHGESINIKRGPAGPSQSVTIKNCYFTDAVGTACIAGNDNGSDEFVCQGLNIYGCVFGPATTGNGVIGTTTRSGWSAVNVFNNTFYSNSTAWLSVGQAGSSTAIKNSCTNVVATNNIIFGTTYAAIADNTTSGILHDYNCYANASGYLSEGHSLIISTNPFVNSATGNYHLAGALPGVALASTYNTDADGVTRGSDGTWDIGAYEYDAGAPPAPTVINVDTLIFRGQ